VGEKSPQTVNLYTREIFLKGSGFKPGLNTLGKRGPTFLKRIGEEKKEKPSGRGKPGLNPVFPPKPLGGKPSFPFLKKLVGP